VLVATAFSVLSPGTERAAVELGRSTLLGKALRRPDQARKVLQTLRREGAAATLRKVQEKLDVTRALGYSCAGVVLQARDCSFAPGDRVACAGTDAATHAEINFIPRNLCAKVPEGVTLDDAAFAALGAIAIHALRLGEAALGEDVAVIGLGPVGLILAQTLRAAGCRVTGFDLRPDRLAVAQRLGIERLSVPDRAALPARGIAAGFERVFLCAASRSAAPVEFAVDAAGDRARIVVVGDVRTDFPRNACYAKELSIVYARSYGPGRYDPSYEEQGSDYPRAHVPWTVQRNLEAFLDLVARRQIALAPLITHRLPIVEAAEAYEVISGGESSLGVVIEYPGLAGASPRASIELRERAPRRAGTLGVGFIGAGSYAVTSLLPHLSADPRVRLLHVANARGLAAKKVGEQFQFAACGTDPGAIFAEPDCDAVFIATRHSLHARLAEQALAAGKAVFVEKPLCVNEQELASLEQVWARDPLPVIVGHNRRFAPATRALEEFFAGEAAQPASIRYTVRAGTLPTGHWLGDPAEGGRIVGEACHFVDWCRHIVGAPLSRIYASLRGAGLEESLHAVLDFEGGSQATLVYEPTAHPGLPKERIEMSRGARSAVLEDFTDVVFLSPDGRRRRSFRGKGQGEMIVACIAGFLNGHAPFSFHDYAATARATLKLLESAASGLPVWLDPSL
jgi:polar amino acid transport system substrate-binding protein